MAGRPLYKSARAGETVERAERDIVIHELEVMTPAAPYRYEWEKAGGSKSKGYRLLSCSGDWIPLVFMLLYLVLFAVGVMPVILRYAT